MARPTVMLHLSDGPVSRGHFSPLRRTSCALRALNRSSTEDSSATKRSNGKEADVSNAHAMRAFLLAIATSVSRLSVVPMRHLMINNICHERLDF